MTGSTVKPRGTVGPCGPGPAGEVCVRSRDVHLFCWPAGRGGRSWVRPVAAAAPPVYAWADR